MPSYQEKGNAVSLTPFAINQLVSNDMFQEKYGYEGFARSLKTISISPIHSPLVLHLNGSYL